MKSGTLIKLFITFTVIHFLIQNVYSVPCVIKGEKGNMFLEVNGEKFDLKGVGCGQAKGKDGTDYLLLAKEMGANTVRTWGIDQGTREYLDRAHELGLKVDAGIWFNHCNSRQSKKNLFSYTGNKAKVKKLEKDTLNYIRKFKNHPAILMWNLGNEVLFFTDEEKERIAFCHFLESIIKKVKKIDPDHPVLYTCANSKNFSYIKKYVPSLDIAGVNTYGGIDYIHDDWMQLELTIPYLVTEAGPLGGWNRPRNTFGKAIDEADYEKAFHYQYLLEEIKKFQGQCLGGFMFHLGDTTQDSMTWWNLTYGKYKRESFHTIKTFYTGKEEMNRPPLCTGLTLNKNVFLPGETISATIKARDREGDSLKYEYLVGTSKENILLHYVNSIVPVKFAQKDDKVIFPAPEKPGIYRLHSFVYDGQENVSTRNICFKVQ